MLDPSLWFTVTDWRQFAVLLPVGLGLGYVGFAFPPLAPAPAVRAGLYLGIVLVYWTFVLATRAATDIVDVQPSFGSVLLNLLFVGAIYLGLKLRERSWR